MWHGAAAILMARLGLKWQAAGQRVKTGAAENAM
jgi:hypothetical protein